MVRRVCHICAEQNVKDIEIYQAGPETIMVGQIVDYNRLTSSSQLLTTF